MVSSINSYIRVLEFILQSWACLSWLLVYLWIFIIQSTSVQNWKTESLLLVARCGRNENRAVMDIIKLLHSLNSSNPQLQNYKYFWSFFYGVWFTLYRPSKIVHCCFISGWNRLDSRYFIDRKMEVKPGNNKVRKCNFGSLVRSSS